MEKNVKGTDNFTNTFMWTDTYQNIYKPTVYNLILQQISYSKMFKPSAHVQKVII
jgi:hypothetical protein